MMKTLRRAATLMVLVYGAALSLAAVAQAADKERALAISHKDPKLMWGGCPPFLPKGCGLAILRGDPTKENADVFFKLPPGSMLPHHWHTSVERMVLVSGRLHITYDDQAPVVLTPGMYAYGPAKLAHKGRCAKGDPCILFIAFQLPVDAVPTEAASK